MKGRFTIELNNVRLNGHHGVYKEERLTGNSFEIDLAIGYTDSEEPIGRLDQTINYAAVYQLVKNIFSEPEDLLETVALKIAAALPEQFPMAECMRLSIRKMNVPIANFSGLVGITYEKSFR